MIVEEVKSNPILMTAFGLSSAGIITFWLKDMPKLLYQFIKRKITTELTITNHNIIFFDFLKWIQLNFPNTNFRKLKITNGKWGSDDAVTSIGYGTHYIRFNKKMYVLNLAKDTGNQTDKDKETLTITTIGMNRKVFNEMIKAVKSMDQDKFKTELYRYQDHWMYVKHQAKRNLDSVYIEKEKKDMIISTLERFINKEEWYIKNGIPYQLGILLYGPPGTGKTSLIKAISSYLDYPIYYLSARNLYKMEHAISSLPEKCIMIIEDIDANSLTHSRDNNENLKLTPPSKEQLKAKGIDPSFLNNFNSKTAIIAAETIDEAHEEAKKENKETSATLSDVLNSLDGMFSVHGRILIATTNHVEQLDSALIRPGRIDLKIEIGFVTPEVAKDFIKNFFPNSPLLNTTIFHNLTVKDGISVAMLQNKILEGKDEYHIMDFLNQ